MRATWLAILAVTGCAKDNGPTLTVTMNFPVTMVSGANPSPLDPLENGTIAFDLVWDTVAFNTGDGTDPAGCKTTYVYGPSVRTATGPDAAVIQAQILDMIPDWAVDFQICASGGSSITTEGSIDALNTSFACFGLTPSSLQTNADGFPEITSFTATMCGATILDVVNNRVLGATNFTTDFATGAGQVP